MEAILSILKQFIITFFIALGILSPPALPQPIPPTSEASSTVMEVMTASSSTATTTINPIDVKVLTQEVSKAEEHAPKRIEGSPLPLNYNASDAKLNAQKIFLLTNIERLQHGKSPLTLNPKLSHMAEIKAKDMIAQQYFAHVSPNGKNVNDLANESGYIFSLVGENLGMGDFMSDKDVVDGWMNSKGHRENILKTQYTEVGISVVLGKGEQREMWYAVQEFGRPKPSCTTPNQEMNTQIETREAQLKTLETQLKDLSSALGKATTPSAYDALVLQYNEKTTSHNQLLSGTKELIATYNASISLYNECIAKENIILEQK